MADYDTKVCTRDNTASTGMFETSVREWESLPICAAERIEISGHKHTTKEKKAKMAKLPKTTTIHRNIILTYKHTIIIFDTFISTFELVEAGTF